MIRRSSCSKVQQSKCYIVMGLHSHFGPFHSSDGSWCSTRHYRWILVHLVIDSYLPCHGWVTCAILVAFPPLAQVCEKLENPATLYWFLRKIDFARQWSQLMPALPWLALPGKSCRSENSHLGGSLGVVGIEARTLLVKASEVSVGRTTLHITTLEHIAKMLESSLPISREEQRNTYLHAYLIRADVGTARVNKMSRYRFGGKWSN